MTDIDDLELSDNPTTDSLSLLIGEALLGQLSADLGGAEISIPYKARPNSPMSVSIGIEAAERISQVWGGMKFDVPIAAGKKSEIMRLYDLGTSKNMIARKVKVTRSHVYNVIDNALNSRQLDLFQQ